MTLVAILDTFDSETTTRSRHSTASMRPRCILAAVSTALILYITVWNYGMFQTRGADLKMSYEYIKSVVNLPENYTSDSSSVQHTANYRFEEFESDLSRSYYIKFSKLMSTWPTEKPKAAIYFLIQSRRINPGYLIGALQRLDRYFTARFNYPVILFHEEDARPRIPELINCSNVSLFFQEVIFRMPPFIPENYTRKHCAFPIGYHHMCRFHSKLVYKQPTMQLLDYAWRLDDDSEILSPIEFDVFEFMRDNGIEYGYEWLTYAGPECVVGLWEAARQYISNNNISTTYFSELPEISTYYNNFELSKVSFWKSKAYEGYIDYIDQLGGIYYNRWGDAPIKTIGLSLFMQRNKTHEFKNIAYRHNSVENKGQ